MRKVLALQHVACESPGGIGSALTRANISMETVRVDLGYPVPTLPNGFDGLVIMGGPMSVYERDRYAHLRDELRLIERALAQNIPILGVCLGSQLLATVLGSHVVPGETKEIGWKPIMWEIAATHDPLFKDVSWQPLTVLHWHGDIYDLPADAVALAHSAQTECQAFRYANHAYGLLFHIEADLPQVEQMTQHFAQELADAEIDGCEILQSAAHYVPSLSISARRVLDAWTGLIEKREL